MRALLMIAALALAVPDRPDPSPKKEAPPQHLIIGAWQHLNETGDGASGYGLLVTPTNSTWSQNGQPILGDGITARIVIDATKSPATIDFIHEHNGTILGIWKVEGEYLTVAVSPGAANVRPTDFRPTGGVQRYKRIK